jgi:hypothetical protein
MRMACCCAAWMIVLPTRLSGFSMCCIAQRPQCGVPYQRCLALSLNLSEAFRVDSLHVLRGLCVEDSVACGLSLFCTLTFQL